MKRQSHVPTYIKPSSGRMHIMRPSTAEGHPLSKAVSFCGLVLSEDWDLRRHEKVDCKNCLKAYENAVTVV